VSVSVRVGVMAISLKKGSFRRHGAGPRLREAASHGL
jgi:hypothetical protein